jgi:hypothetical protein
MKHNQTKFIIAICCVCGFILSCGVSGQVGGTFNFHKDKQQLEAALDSLYTQHPEYKVPAKWAQYNTFSTGKSTYLEGKTFYFASQPEEMYYVSLIDDSAMSGDSARAGLAIRAINRGSDKWLKEEDLDYKDERKAQKRFYEEIVSKLEGYTKSKASREE